MSNFDEAFQYTLENEGGFSNDAADSGGATRYGITRSEASRWYRRPVSVVEMREFPLEEAKQIYKAWYWRPLGCEGIQFAGVASGLFDIGVVRGIGIPPKYAQVICNQHGADLALDGHMGPKTIAAVNSLSADVFLRAYAERVEQGFRNIVSGNASQKVFLKGWVRRARRLLTLIHQDP